MRRPTSTCFLSYAQAFVFWTKPYCPNAHGRPAQLIAGCRPRRIPLVMIMVAVVPVAIAMPAVFMVTPPLLALSPAALACFMKFMTPVVCLAALVAMVLDGLVELMFRMLGASAATIIVGGRAIHGYKQENGAQRECRK
ncbi:MAG TPA: hypothetical protein VKZ53_31990 [Candidatus Angelobacter sp.]|nr:hypothetical protein [Candidatus Angelobacter sp.]